MNKIFIGILAGSLLLSDVVRADASGAVIGGVIGGVAGMFGGAALAHHDRHHRAHRCGEPRHVVKKRVEVIEEEGPGQGIQEEVEVVYVRQPQRIVRHVYHEEPTVMYHVGCAPWGPCAPMYTHVSYHCPAPVVHETYSYNHHHHCGDYGWSPAPFVGTFLGATAGAMIGGMAFGD